MRAVGHVSFLHRRAIVVVALALAVGAGAAGSTVFGRAQPFGFNDPGSESSRAQDLIERASGEQALPEVLLLARPKHPVDTAAGRAAVNRIARELGAIKGVARAIAPTARGPFVSMDGKLALIQGILRASVDNPADVGERVEARFSGRGRIEAGGIAVAAHQLNQTTEDEVRRIELYASPLLLLISFVVFRGLVAALLPLLVGGLSIIFTLAGLRLLSEVIVIDVFALNVVTVLGLGLAIDYSLFMVSRYREELVRSGPSGVALRDTLGAVGRMVCFSAAIVAAAAGSLVVFPQRFLYSSGIACALVVILSAAVVILILPAVLALLGDRVNALAPAALQRRKTSTRWRSLARVVLRWPLPIASAVAAMMLIVGLPFLRVHLTRADAGTLSDRHSARVVDDLVRKRFRSDPSATVLVVLPRGVERKRSIEATVGGLSGTGGIAKVGQPRRVGSATVVAVETRAPPYSDQAVELVKVTRSLDWGGPALVTGGTAELIDQRASLRDHLPEALAIVLAATTIALVLMTGSVVLPLLAVICNTLTLSVAFGVLVLVFQDQRLESVLSYTGVGALDLSVPVLLFAVVFGLSTDYGLFLISRVAEAREDGYDDSGAIAIGLERTGRIITAAALLFAVAMGSFIFSEMIFIKEVAVGVSIAVLVDAAVVRTLLLPALMRLCGRTTWWTPAPARGLGRVRA